MAEWIVQVSNRGGHRAGHKKLDLKGSHEEGVQSNGSGHVRSFHAIFLSYTACDCERYLFASRMD